MDGLPDPIQRPVITVEDLRRWEDHGASWRALSVGDEVAVIELCTCYGEAVDVVRGEAPDVIAYVRERAAPSP